ncbi:MAG TPA: hypothetical protein VK427_22660 [Kofleriaceae bacterium]|nr:hypothetical protein [Kofleriaceae bacterium]
MGRFGLSIAFLLFAACGSVKDSGTVDAGPTGPDADTSGNATVTTKGFVDGQTVGAVVADVDIISMLPNNTVLATAKTDAAGMATIKVFPGGSVVAIYKRIAPDPAADVVVIGGVQPGDALQFGRPQISSSAAGTNLGTQSYSWPAAPTAAVNSYRVQTSCAFVGVAAPTLSTSAAQTSTCHKNPMDILYVAFTNTSPTTLHHCGTRQNVTFMPGANVPLFSWQTAGSFIANITGLPASLGAGTNVTTELAIVLDDSTTAFLPGGFASGSASGGAFTGNMRWCAAGERTQAELSFVRPGFARMRVLDAIDSTATSWTVASPVLPPWLERDSATVSFARGKAQWSLVKEGNNASDGVYVRIVYEVKSENFASGQLHMLLPPGTEEVALPRLPAQYADQVYAQDRDMFLSRVGVLEFPSIDSYDALRARGIGLAICPECAVRAGDLQRVIISGN